MLGGWKVEGVSELSDLILQSGEAPGIYDSKKYEILGNRKMCYFFVPKSVSNQ